MSTAECVDNSEEPSLLFELLNPREKCVSFAVTTCGFVMVLVVITLFAGYASTVQEQVPETPPSYGFEPEIHCRNIQVDLYDRSVVMQDEFYYEYSDRPEDMFNPYHDLGVTATISCTVAAHQRGAVFTFGAKKSFIAYGEHLVAVCDQHSYTKLALWMVRGVPLHFIDCRKFKKSI